MRKGNMASICQIQETVVLTGFKIKKQYFREVVYQKIKEIHPSLLG